MDNILKNKIYRGVDHSGIHIDFCNFEDNKPICVFGILNNKIGREIENEMMEWLHDKYNVIRVYQEYPGVLYEYPALRFAQYFIMNSEKYDYCLYIHTKGAFMQNSCQPIIRKFWRDEFSTEKSTKYIDVISNENAVVSCPFSGPNRETWYNAFFANKKAWKSLGTLTPSENRYVFEYMWRNFPDVKIIGIVADKIEAKLLGSKIL